MIQKGVYNVVRQLKILIVMTIVIKNNYKKVMIMTIISIVNN